MTHAAIDALRASVPFEEFDYQTLLQALRHYARPRDRATRLLETGAIIRVKKGLYVFGPTYRRLPYSVELLANLISGPSYVSFEHALSSYGLIPERVTTITSATIGKARTFDTPVGLFSYRHVPPHVFWVGVTLVDVGANRTCLIASREKALCDTLVASRGLSARSRSTFQTALADDLRINMDQLATLDRGLVSDLASQWPSQRLARLAVAMSRTSPPMAADAGRIAEQGVIARAKSARRPWHWHSPRRWAPPPSTWTSSCRPTARN